MIIVSLFAEVGVTRECLYVYYSSARSGHRCEMVDPKVGFQSV